VQYDAELHLVHKRIDAGAQGTEYAVLGIFFDASKDIESGLLERLKFNKLPLQNDSELDFSQLLHKPTPPNTPAQS
jgi:hypothetical protein